MLPWSLYTLLVRSLIALTFSRKAALMPKVERSVTAENEFTPTLGGDHSNRIINVSISGTFVAVVRVQRSFDNGATFHTMESYNSPTERIGDFAEAGVLWRAGVPTGDFTSGPVEIRLSY